MEAMALYDQAVFYGVGKNTPYIHLDHCPFAAVLFHAYVWSMAFFFYARQSSLIFIGKQ